MQYLRQSTGSQAVLIGPFVDSTDGVTAETGLTIANTDIRLSANGGNMAAKNSGGGTHDENGWYTITLDATDTATVGRLQVSCVVSGALPVFSEFQVVEEAVYDALFASGATLDVNVTTIEGVDATNQINAACDASIETYNLDHWMAVAESGDVVSNSALAKLVSNGATAAWADFDNTDMSLEAVGLKLDAVPTAAENRIEMDSNSTQLAKIGTISDLGNGSTIGANLGDLAGATFDTSTDSQEAIRNRGDSAWTTGAGGTPPQLLQSTTIATLASQTSFTLTAGSADDDAYNGHLAIVTDQSTSTQKCVGIISDYTGSSKTVTLESDPGIFTMAVGDTIDIVAVNTAASAPTVTQIRQEMDSNSTQLAAIVADTNELQTNQGNWLTATGFSTHSAADVRTEIDSNSTQLAAIVEDTGTTLPATLSTIAGYIDTEVSAIKAVTDNLPDSGALTSIATASAVATVDTNVDAILVDTGTTIPAQISGLNNISAADVNAQVVDALNVDTYDEPGQGTPSATASLVAKIGYLYKAWRNRSTQDASTYELYNDDGTTVDHKATVSDDGTDFDRGEVTTGP